MRRSPTSVWMVAGEACGQPDGMLVKRPCSEGARCARLRTRTLNEVSAAFRARSARGTTKLTGGDEAQRNPRPMQRFVRPSCRFHLPALGAFTNNKSTYRPLRHILNASSTGTWLTGEFFPNR